MDPLKYFPLNMGIFRCYVSLPEDIYIYLLLFVWVVKETSRLQCFFRNVSGTFRVNLLDAIVFF